MIAARAGGFAPAVEGGFSLGDERRKSRPDSLARESTQPRTREISLSSPMRMNVHGADVK